MSSHSGDPRECAILRRLLRAARLVAGARLFAFGPHDWLRSTRHAPLNCRGLRLDYGPGRSPATRVSDGVFEGEDRDPIDCAQRHQLVQTRLADADKATRIRLGQHRVGVAEDVASPLLSG